MAAVSAQRRRAGVTLCAAALLVAGAGVRAERHHGPAESCRCGLERCALHSPARPPAPPPSCHSAGGIASGHAHSGAHSTPRADAGTRCVLSASCGHSHGGGHVLLSDARAVLPPAPAPRPAPSSRLLPAAAPAAPGAPTRAPEPPPPKPRG